MWDDEGFKRKSTRVAAIEAAKRIKQEAEGNVQKCPLYRSELGESSDTATSDNNTRRQRGRKQKKEDLVCDFPEVTQDLLKNILKRSNPPNCDDMLKKRRGRPPKLEAAKCPSTRVSRNVKYNDPRCEEADYDVNLRRESYGVGSFVLNNEPKVATIFSGPKQLRVGDGGISYKESLMNFTKDLGPTAQKVAHRMLQRQGKTYQALQVEPLFQLPDSLPHQHSVDLNSMDGSAGNTTINQVSQPLISFRDSNTDDIANNKGKKIMVDDGKSNCNIWDVANNLEFFFGKQKGGVKIGHGSFEKKDFGNKNLYDAQVGNQSTINQTGSFWANYNLNMNQNINKNSGTEDTSGQKWTPSNGKPNSYAYPSTGVSHSQDVSSSYLGFDAQVFPFAWVPQPPMHSPTPLQPPQNWWMPPPATTSSVVNESIWKEQESELALSLNMQKKDQESNIRSRNFWSPSQANQFLPARAHGPDRQQSEDWLFMPLPPLIMSRLMPSAVNHEQDPLPFGTQQDSGFQMGNHQLYPPPGI